MDMDYARHTHQELIMVQLDLVKAYDYVNWPFVFGLIHTMVLDHICLASYFY